MCEGRVVLSDNSETIGQNNTGLHGHRNTQTAPARRAVPPVVVGQNQLLHQLAEYSSLCVGIASVLTDGNVFLDGGDEGQTASTTAEVFETCAEEHASIEIPTLEPSFISTVRVSKVCRGLGHDPDVAGLRVKIKTSLGLLACGTIAGAGDSSCSGKTGPQFWERQCDTFGVEIASSAVVVVRESRCSPPDAAHCAPVVPKKPALLVPSPASAQPDATKSSASLTYGKIVVSEIQAEGKSCLTPITSTPRRPTLRSRPAAFAAGAAGVCDSCVRARMGVSVSALMIVICGGGSRRSPTCCLQLAVRAASQCHEPVPRTTNLRAAGSTQHRIPNHEGLYRAQCHVQGQLFGSMPGSYGVHRRVTCEIS